MSSTYSNKLGPSRTFEESLRDAIEFMKKQHTPKGQRMTIKFMTDEFHVCTGKDKYKIIKNISS